MSFKYLKVGFLSLASVAVLVACSGDNASQETTSQASQETTTSQAAESSESTSEETSSQDDSQSSESSGSSESSSASNGERSDATAEFEIDMAAAVDIFLEQHPGASIEEVDFDDDDSHFEYQIDGFDDSNEYELDVHADTGETTERDNEREDDTNDNEAINFDAIITEREAIDIALGELGQDVAIEGWTLDADDGRTEYEIETRQDDNVTIDAETGDILEVERDD